MFPAPFGVRLNKNEDTAFEPDIVVICDEKKIEDGKISLPDVFAEW